MTLAEELRPLLAGDVRDDEETIREMSRDASLFEVRPKVVVYPRSVDDLKRLVRFVAREREKGRDLSLTPRAGGSDMSGGPLGDSIIVNVTRYLNRLIELGEGYAVVEPGLYYRDFERATLEKGYLLPCYTASKELNTLGGMVGNNSAGEKTLSYGKTDRYVEELSVVLADGEEYLMKPLTRAELDRKMRLDSFEGRVYRDLYALVSDNKALIAGARPNVAKNSAGYALWNVWDGTTFNPAQLIVGSQGTLGIVTRIRLSLVKPAGHAKMLTIFLKDLAPLPGIVNAVLAERPESFESYDDYTLKLAVRFLPELVALMKAKSVFSLLLRFLPELGMVLSGGVPKLILIAEFTGESDEEALEKAKRAAAALVPFGVPTRVTRDAREAEKYWVVRRESFNLLRKHLRGKRTAPFIDDIVVRPEFLPEFLPRLRAILAEYRIIYTVAGHIGDGNFHIIPLMDMRDPKTRRIIPELSDRVYDLVLEYKGSITGEHNDGIIRTPYLERMYGEKVCNLFKEVKHIFDPLNIMNPGKKVGGTLEYAVTHFVTE